MLSSWFLAVLTLLVSALGVSASFVDSLPECWGNCIDDSDADCESLKCLCKASGKSSFLPDTVSCARSKCDTQDWALDALLVPLQAYCGAIGKGIPSSIISSARSAATESAKPITTDSPKSEDGYGYGQKSKSKDSDDDVQTTVSTTITTTTVKDGTTLEILIPVVVCPSTVEYGSTITSTIGKATSTPNSAAASPSPSAAPSHPLTTPTNQGKVGPSSSATAKATADPKHAGSPFDNMQAEASQWSISGALIGMALVAGVFARL